MSVSQRSRRHPLQRLESPSKGFSGAIHVLGLASFYTSFKFLIENPNPISESYGWHFQYLTILGLSLSTLTFTLALTADLLSPHPDLARVPYRAKSYLALISAPLNLTISILYWSLRAINPSLVVPPTLPKLPLPTDLTFHLFPALLLAIDALLLSPPWPTTPVNRNAPLITLLSSTGLAFAYWFWIELCYSRNGFYPYPIFEMLGTTQRVGLFVLSGAIMWVVGSGLRVLYAVVNGYEELEGGKKGRKI